MMRANVLRPRGCAAESFETGFNSGKQTFEKKWRQ